MTEHHVDDSYQCPQCAGRLNSAANATPGSTRPPRPGDFTLCCYCEAVLRFDVAGLREATADDLAELSPVERLDLDRARLALSLALEDRQ